LSVPAVLPAAACSETAGFSFFTGFPDFSGSADALPDVFFGSGSRAEDTAAFILDALPVTGAFVLAMMDILLIF